MIGERALCSGKLVILLDLAVPVGRTEDRTRCKRRACATFWSDGASPATRAREIMQRRHAREGLYEARWSRTTDNKVMWRKQGWLEPHVVYIEHLPRLRVFRVGLSAQRVWPDTARQLRRRGGVIVDEVTVENRHAAVLVKLDVLELVDLWRRELHPSRLQKGGTEVWRQSGPTVDLIYVAEMIED
ncbi:hypothetical protein [Jiangella rhizosphaerae]|uniref:Uncharacterized protein n=1 Tax=Jiangella rhizosphaerae TaxID=2293569 RepID=A0A418KGX0_9ACTN|nr:hypothetical protein [Jiangella rhizosphaerae]RIQ11348.1 hypothetical protein DY240_29070 [Jiangella rhizosphaerae]